MHAASVYTKFASAEHGFYEWPYGNVKSLKQNTLRYTRHWASVWTMIICSCLQLKSQISQMRKAFGFHMINNTGHQSHADTSSKEIELSDQFEYDNLETDRLLLHDYTVSVIKSKYFYSMAHLCLVRRFGLLASRCAPF